MSVVGVFPSRTPPYCWIEVLLLFPSCVARFFAAHLLGICPRQVAAWLLLRKLVIVFHLKRETEASLFLCFRVEFQEHVFLFCQLRAEL